MKSRRKIGWALAGGIGVSLFVAVALHRKVPGELELSREVHGVFPARFRAELKERREQQQARPHDPEAVRKLTYLYQANRRYREAIAGYAVLESKAPGLTARDHYYLADIAQDEGELERAVTELNAVVAQDPGYLPARVGKADALFKWGREEDARKEYAIVVAQVPNHPQATVGLARLALLRGEDELAIGLLEKLLAAHPEASSAAGLLAQILRRRGELERADALEKWSRQKREPVPDDPWKTDLLADCYDSQRLALKFEELFLSGQMDDAVRFLRRVEEVDPESTVPQLLRGYSRARANHDAEAVTEYRSALNKGGDAEKIVPLMITSLLKLGRVEEAVAVGSEYAAKQPDSQPLLLAHADAVTRLGDDAKTQAVLEKLLEKEPYLYAQNMSLAKILWAAGKRDEAAECLRRIVKVYPNDVASRGLLGQYFLERSEPGPAIPILEQALAQAADSSPAHERLQAMLATACLQVANADLEKTAFSEAMVNYDKALLLAPKELDAYLGKANACVQLKDFARAAEVLEKMAALDPQNPTIFLSLGDVLYQGGNPEQARRRWQQALPLVAKEDTELRAVLDQRLSGRISPEDFK